MTDPDDTPRRRTLLRAAAVLGFWTLVGLASAVQSQVAASFEGYDVGVWTSITRSVPVWWFWALATPAIAFLGRRFPLEGGAWPLSIPVHLAGAAALTALHAVWLVVLFRELGMGGEMGESGWEFFRILLLSRLYLDLLTYAATLGGVYAIDYHDKFREREVRASRLETALARARVDALRMQLNPHFLFNALNAVAAQVRADRGPAAVTMLGGLGDLLRYALDIGEEPVVPLWRELAFLDRYLDIERVRFADRLTVEVDVPEDLRDALVPPLLLQPLVENAVRHGIAPREAPGRIDVAARRVDGRLVLVVRDDGLGLGKGADAPSSGVGLANARERLSELYGDRGRLDVAPREKGGVEVVVEIPWEEARP